MARNLVPETHGIVSLWSNALIGRRASPLTGYDLKVQDDEIKSGQGEDDGLADGLKSVEER